MLNWVKNLDPKIFRITLVTVFGGPLEVELPDSVSWRILPRYCYTIEVLKKRLEWLGKWWSDAGYLFFRSVRLRQALGELNPDIVVTHLPNESVPVMATKFLGSTSPWPVVCWIHNVPHAGFSRLELTLQKLLYPKMDGWVAVSSQAAIEFSQRYGVPSELIAVEWNPHDLASMQKLSRQDSAEWLGSGLRLLAVGRLVEQKNFHFLLQVAKLLKSHRGWTLTVVGGGEQEQSLSAKIRELELEDRVLLAGEKENPYPFFREADLLLLTSHYEGLPGVLVEAMTFGVPVVALRGRGGTAEALGEGRYGILVDEPCPKAFARQVSALLESRELREEWSRKSLAGRERFALRERIPRLENRLLCHCRNHYGWANSNRPSVLPSNQSEDWFYHGLIRDGRERVAWQRSTVNGRLSRFLLDTLRRPRLRGLRSRIREILENGNFSVYRPTKVEAALETVEEFADSPQIEWKRLRHSLEQFEKNLMFRIVKELLKLTQDLSYLRVIHLAEPLCEQNPNPLPTPSLPPTEASLSLLGPAWWRHLMIPSMELWNIGRPLTIVAVSREFEFPTLRPEGEVALWLLEPGLTVNPQCRPDIVYTISCEERERLRSQFSCPVKTLSPCLQGRFGSPWSISAHHPDTPRQWSQVETTGTSTENNPRWSSEAQTLLGVRNRLRQRLVEDVISEIAADLDLPPLPKKEPVFVTCTNRPERLDWWLQQVLQQSVRGKVVLLCHGSGFSEAVRKLEKHSDIEIEIVFAPKTLNHGQCAQRAFEKAYACGDILVCMDDDDWYGPNYASDLISGLKFSPAKLVGKASFLVETGEERYLLSPGQEYRYSPLFSGGALAFHREVLEKVTVRPHQTWWDTKFFRDAWNEGLPQLTLDQFNYCYNRTGHNSSNASLFGRALRYASKVPSDQRVEELCYV